ncbi:hypothetical protein SAMN05428974_2460 [Sphingopyxis sp. YR583]|nr:hypothetical protein SAMN05428974_2460 [Sphingopyxis sp. YR583]
MMRSESNFFWLLLPLISGCGATESPNDRVQENVVGADLKQHQQDTSTSTTTAQNKTSGENDGTTSDRARLD